MTLILDSFHSKAKYKIVISKNILNKNMFSYFSHTSIIYTCRDAIQNSLFLNRKEVNV